MLGSCILARMCAGTTRRALLTAPGALIDVMADPSTSEDASPRGWVCSRPAARSKCVVQPAEASWLPCRSPTAAPSAKLFLGGLSWDTSEGEWPPCLDALLGATCG